MRSAVRLRLVAAWALLIVASVTGAMLVTLGPRGDLIPISWPTLLGLSGLIALMVALTAILVLRRPGHRIGWLFAGLASFLALSFFSDPYVRVSYIPGVQPLPGALALGWMSAWGPAVLWWLIAMLLLLFPTGHLPSRRWRPVAWAAAVVYGLMAAAGMFGSGRLVEVGPPNPLAIPAARPLLDWAGDLIWIASTAAVVVCAASLVARYRGGDGIERRQLKWLALSGLLIAAGGVVILVAAGIEGDNALTTVAGLLFGGGLVSVPIFATVAILRYRLYAIDRIVSRTLSYAVVTAVLASLYAVAVFGLSAVVASVGGGSEIAVAGATLAVAAAFQPVRRRVQHVVNRRFNRDRYDAERTVAGFAERLRDRVDVEDVKGDLLDTARRVVQPARAHLWLRPDR